MLLITNYPAGTHHHGSHMKGQLDKVPEGEQHPARNNVFRKDGNGTERNLAGKWKNNIARFRTTLGRKEETRRKPMKNESINNKPF